MEFRTFLSLKKIYFLIKTIQDSVHAPDEWGQTCRSLHTCVKNVIDVNWVKMDNLKVIVYLSSLSTTVICKGQS